MNRASGNMIQSKLNYEQQKNFVVGRTIEVQGGNEELGSLHTPLNKKIHNRHYTQDKSTSYKLVFEKSQIGSMVKSNNGDKQIETMRFSDTNK